jgi:small neutral amino acid transporter SnatA (MarC family)
MSARSMTDMERHPDIAELRARYDRAAETSMAHAADGLTFLSGLYLAISPWVVGFSGRTALSVNNLITGLAVALLAVGFASAYGRTHGVAWVAPLIGVWAIIAPWVVRGASPSTATVVNNVVTGAAVAVFAIVAAGIGMAYHRRGIRRTRPSSS